jgi:hypothetical protein
MIQLYRYDGENSFLLILHGRRAGRPTVAGHITTAVRLAPLNPLLAVAPGGHGK